MDSPWKLIGTVIGCVVVDLGARFVWQLAKDRGYQEALDDMGDEGYIAPGKEGEPVIVVIDGKRYRLTFEPVSE
jgi:hypothetical protein